VTAQRWWEWATKHSQDERLEKNGLYYCNKGNVGIGVARLSTAQNKAGAPKKTVTCDTPTKE